MSALSSLCIEYKRMKGVRNGRKYRQKEKWFCGRTADRNCDHGGDLDPWIWRMVYREPEQQRFLYIRKCNRGDVSKKLDQLNQLIDKYYLYQDEVDQDALVEESIQVMQQHWEIRIQFITIRMRRRL